jgi:hypothetical protein
MRLVYLPNLRGGFSAEKWPDDKLENGNGQIPAKEYKLTAGEERMKIAILEQRYPPPDAPLD